MWDSVYLCKLCISIRTTGALHPCFATAHWLKLYEYELTLGDVIGKKNQPKTLRIAHTERNGPQVWLWNTPLKNLGNITREVKKVSGLYKNGRGEKNGMLFRPILHPSTWVVDTFNKLFDIIRVLWVDDPATTRLLALAHTHTKKVPQLLRFFIVLPCQIWRRPSYPVAH